MTLASEIRKESNWLLYVFPFIGRSSVQGWMVHKLSEYTGYDKMLKPHDPFDIAYISAEFKIGEQSFSQLAESYHLTPRQAWWWGVIKLVFLHLGHVLFFFVAWYSVKERMDYWQSRLASLVVAKELVHLVLILQGIRKCPDFLHFSPASERQIRTVIKYFLTPDLFILEGLIDGKSIWFGLFTTALSLGSFGSIGAMIVGLCGHGVMTPALLAGYVMSAGGIWIYWYYAWTYAVLQYGLYSSHIWAYLSCLLMVTSFVVLMLMFGLLFSITIVDH